MGRVLYEDHMYRLSSRWIITIILAILIYLGCEVGRIVGLEMLGLKISVIWPATGISLACLLLFGNQAWLGIFLGNVLYNVPHLVYIEGEDVKQVIIGIIISLSSTLQALTAAFFIRNLSSPGFFNNIKDIFIFLLFGGVFSCLIAPSISVPALVFSGYLDWDQAGFTWLTFWIGDTTGIYVLTPMIIIWATYPLAQFKASKLWEAAITLFLFCVIFYLTFVLNYPVIHLYIPLVLWITFRFERHWSTLTLFLLAFTIIIFNPLGYGTFIKTGYIDHHIVLVTYIEVIVAITLILSGSINERQEAWNLLQSYNKNLEETILERTKQLNEMHDTVNLKQKLISLGMLTAGIGHEIKIPLNAIDEYVKGGKDCLHGILASFKDMKKKLDPASAAAMENTLETLQNCVQKIQQSEKQANKIVEVIIQTAVAEREGATEIKSINLHILLNKVEEQIKHEMDKRYPNFHVDVRNEYSPMVSMIPGIPEDLTRVFFLVIDNSWHALKQKQEKLTQSFSPVIIVKTIDKKEFVEIHFYDNGIGIPSEVLTKVFQPFITTKLPGEGAGLGLSIVHDIIVQEHQGKITIDSTEGEFTEVKIRLPKLHTPVTR